MECLILHSDTSSVTIHYIFPLLHFVLLLRVFAFPVPWEQRQVLWLSTLGTVLKSGHSSKSLICSSGCFDHCAGVWAVPAFQS